MTGTDVVRLTSQGLCGPGVATFTANVVDPGTPVITSFTADPPRGCGASSNIVLGWTTENARGVTIDVAPAPYPYSANSATGITITGSTTAMLTAFGIFGGIGTRDGVAHDPGRRAGLRARSLPRTTSSCRRTRPRSSSP